MLTAVLRRISPSKTHQGALLPFDRLSWVQRAVLSWVVWNVVRRHNRNLFPWVVPVRSVGVLGDGHTYHPSVFLVPGPNCRYSIDELGKISTDIINKVPGVGRVLFDITSLANQPSAQV